MNKIILENRSDLSMLDFIKLAEKVIEGGRISNEGKQYCYLTAFTVEDSYDYHIVSELNEKSDKLILYKASK
jgi:hypothetical protein